MEWDCSLILDPVKIEFHWSTQIFAFIPELHCFWMKYLWTIVIDCFVCNQKPALAIPTGANLHKVVLGSNIQENNINCKISSLFDVQRSCDRRVNDAHWPSRNLKHIAYHLKPPSMDRLQTPPKRISRARKTFWAQKATREARNVIDSFENFIRERTRQQIAGASVAIALTLIIFLYSLYIGNYLIALIVIAVWVATWKRHHMHSRTEWNATRKREELCNYTLRFS